MFTNIVDTLRELGTLQNTSTKTYSSINTRILRFSVYTKLDQVHCKCRKQCTNAFYVTEIAYKASKPSKLLSLYSLPLFCFDVMDSHNSDPRTWELAAPTIDPTSSWLLPRSTAIGWLNEEDRMSSWHLWWGPPAPTFWDHWLDAHRVIRHTCDEDERVREIDGRRERNNGVFVTCTRGPTSRVDLAVRIVRWRNLFVPPLAGAASQFA